jgi:hypothetical protein
MARYRSFGVLPQWVPADTGEPQGDATPKAAHKIFHGAKFWNLSLTIDWTITDGGSYTNTASGSVNTDFGAMGSVGDEFDIIRPPGFGGFAIGTYAGAATDITDEWTFSGGTSNSPGLDGARVVIGTAAGVTTLNPGRTSYTSDLEFSCVGYVYFKSPNPFYDHDVIGEPDDLGTSIEVTLPLTWERAVAGAPFFGKVEDTASITQDGLTGTYIVSCTVTPSEYWGWSGKINTTTGEPT